MYVIKYYPNRKLYDTVEKKYITSKDIVQLIRQGKSICIVEHTSGDEVTTRILLRIVFENSHHLERFIPHALIAEILNVGKESLQALRRVLSQLPGFNRLVNEVIKERLINLNRSGEIEPGYIEKLLKILTQPIPISQYEEIQLGSQANEPEDELILEKIQKILLTRNAASWEDLRLCQEKLQTLEEKVALVSTR